LICIPLQFYYAFTNLFLNKRRQQCGRYDDRRADVGALLHASDRVVFSPPRGQIHACGRHARLGIGYVLFAYGNAGPGVWLFWIGILLHGICYDFFFVTGQIYIDRKASLALRAAAQGLISFITYGLGMFVGSWLSGVVVDHYAQHGADSL